jgi:hypothetical protein
MQGAAQERMLRGFGEKKKRQKNCQNRKNKYLSNADSTELPKQLQSHKLRL